MHLVFLPGFGILSWKKTEKISINSFVSIFENGKISGRQELQSQSTFLLVISVLVLLSKELQLTVLWKTLWQLEHLNWGPLVDVGLSQVPHRLFCIQNSGGGGIHKTNDNTKDEALKSAYY